jgi:hypothetical protein
MKLLLAVKYFIMNIFRLIYTVFFVQAYQKSTELLSTWCRAAAFFSANGAALSQEVPTVIWVSNQSAL